MKKSIYTAEFRQELIRSFREQTAFARENGAVVSDKQAKGTFRS